MFLYVCNVQVYIMRTHAVAKCAVLTDTCVTQNNSTLQCSVVMLISHIILVLTEVAKCAKRVKIAKAHSDIFREFTIYFSLVKQ